MAWFSVRSVYFYGKKADGVNIYEERMVCISAETAEKALEKAKLESEQYAKDHGMIPHPTRAIYEQEGTSGIDGYELWSMPYQSTETLEVFYEQKFSQYDFRP